MIKCARQRLGNALSRTSGKSQHPPRQLPWRVPKGMPVWVTLRPQVRRLTVGFPYGMKG